MTLVWYYLRFMPESASVNYQQIIMTSRSESAQNHLYSADLSDKRVLIVDRHPMARDALRLMLANLGITKVHGAGSSQEVLRQARGNTFDVIFSDYMLEDGRDGQQLLEELRLQKLVPLSTVFIIVTSERGYHNVIGVAELAPDDYLVKPFTAEQLQGRLAKALYRKNDIAQILRSMDSGAYQKALTACNDYIEAQGEFLIDVMRIKGEMLNTLGRYDDAIVHFREILAVRPLPWAKMGLATALRAKNQLPEAEALARELITEHKHFLVAHDFLAGVLEQSGKLAEAQTALTDAAAISPHNTLRQRVVGDIAMRTGDLPTAERAYQTALNRTRGSSISTTDDYANLSRALIQQNKTAQARNVAQELRRERRLDNASEVAALTIDSLAYKTDGNETAAKESLQKALKVHGNIGQLSEKLTVDLAQAALSIGDKDKANELLRQVIAENPDDPTLHQMVETAFERAGEKGAGQALVESVSKELIRINNQGVLIAREGKLQESVDLLSQAADRMPNIQFLVNASNATFTLLDRQGWTAEAAERGLSYLLKAEQKDPRNPKVVSAYDFFQHVAGKYGIAVKALRAVVLESMKKGGRA